MNLFISLIKIANKVKVWLNNKKTYLTSAAGAMVGVSDIINNLLRWANGQIDLNQLWSLSQPDFVVIWGALTVCFLRAGISKAQQAMKAGGNDGK